MDIDSYLRKECEETCKVRVKEAHINIFVHKNRESDGDIDYSLRLAKLEQEHENREKAKQKKWENEEQERIKKAKEEKEKKEDEEDIGLDDLSDDDLSDLESNHKTNLERPEYIPFDVDKVPLERESKEYDPNDPETLYFYVLTNRKLINNIDSTLEVEVFKWDYQISELVVVKPRMYLPFLLTDENGHGVGNSVHTVWPGKESRIDPHVFYEFPEAEKGEDLQA